MLKYLTFTVLQRTDVKKKIWKQIFLHFLLGPKNGQIVFLTWYRTNNLFLFFLVLSLKNNQKTFPPSRRLQNEGREAQIRPCFVSLSLVSLYEERETNIYYGELQDTVQPL